MATEKRYFVILCAELMLFTYLNFRTPSLLPETNINYLGIDSAYRPLQQSVIYMITIVFCNLYILAVFR